MAGVPLLYFYTTLSRTGISLHIVSPAQVSLPNKLMMLLPQHMAPRLGGQAAADVLPVKSCPQYNSSRPVARRASLKVSAFETQTQPFKKSSASSSRCIPDLVCEAEQPSIVAACLAYKAGMHPWVSPRSRRASLTSTVCIKALTAACPALCCAMRY